MSHHCHAEGCSIKVPPSMFMCRQHWFSLPHLLRRLIWTWYVPGQEIRKDPTDNYVQTAQLCIAWLAEKEGKPNPYPQFLNIYRAWSVIPKGQLDRQKVLIRTVAQDLI